MFLLAALVGFTRSFYLQSWFDFPELPFHLYVHGVVLTVWFLIAGLQPWLIKTDNTAIHRKLGIAGVFVAVGAICTGLWTVVLRDAPIIDEQPARAAGNLASLFMFGYCVAFGVWKRRESQTHKRLMLMASIPILAPALDRIARIPVLNEFWGKVLFWFPAPPEVAFATVAFFSLLIMVAVYDLVTIRRIHKGTAIGLASIFVLTPASVYAFIASGAWAGFVRMLV